MTNEEKAKAYDEALEKAREFHKSKEGIYVLVAETIFPELRESEDERMHKLNLWFLRKYKEISHYPGNSEKGVDMVISYLEKQKEQKPVDYEAELKKCKDNPLYFYDKYVYIKQKPAEWSEEDKQILHSFEVICQRLIENPHGEKFEVERSYAKKMLAWLKFLPERFNLQPKQERSEDLEEAAEKYGSDYPAYNDDQFIAENAFKAGAEWQKAKMMESVVKADVNTYKDLTSGKSWAEFVVKMPTNNIGDKARIIIVKEQVK